MGYALIIMMHVGMMGSGNSNAITTLKGFKDKAECTRAGNAAQNLAAGTVKEIKFACVEVSQ